MKVWHILGTRVSAYVCTESFFPKGRTSTIIVAVYMQISLAEAGMTTIELCHH